MMTKSVDNSNAVKAGLLLLAVIVAVALTIGLIAALIIATLVDPITKGGGNGLPHKQVLASGLPGTEYVRTETVSGNLQNGVQFTAPVAGTYRFEYYGGSYAIRPTEKAPANMHPWLTTVLIFKGSSVAFDSRVVKWAEAVGSLADHGYSRTQDQAIGVAARQSSYSEIVLSSGQTVTLVGVDERQAYADNTGYVTVRISRVS